MSTTPLLERRTLLLLAASNVSPRLRALLFIDGSFEHHLSTTRSLSTPPHRDPVHHPHTLVVIRTRSRGVIDSLELNSPPTDSVARDNPQLVVLGAHELPRAAATAGTRCGAGSTELDLDGGSPQIADSQGTDEVMHVPVVRSSNIRYPPQKLLDFAREHLSMGE
ncbi:hypothetical protein B0H14DRAFT_2633112 [Mycena olivaceomarginata]|nr:hypothetical protein B0H14DRAFT_2633112 [Mycena olivaceomarginata]